MSEEKKILPTFQISYNKDLSKHWFIYYYDEQGRRVKKYSGINKHDSFAARMQAAKGLIKELKKEFGTYPAPDQSLLIRKSIYKYLERQRNVWRKKTYQTNKSKVDILFEWLDKHNRKVTNASMKSFFDDLITRRHPTTYNTYLDKLAGMFRKIGHPNLLKDIEKVKAYSTPARYFQQHHIEQLSKYMSEHQPQLWLFVKFIYYCFIRPGDELRHLKAGDILFNEEKIIIRSQTSKNHKTQYVAIPQAFLPDLQFVLKMPAGALLFPSPVNAYKPIGINTMGKRHRETLRSFGYSSDYKLYSWKHTGAVALVKAGVGLKAIQLQMRHHSLDQTDMYLRQLGVGDFDDLKRNFPSIEFK